MPSFISSRSNLSFVITLILNSIYLLFQGKWKPRKIPNPDYFHDPNPYKMTSIGGIGIELWSMSSEIYFDNMVRLFFRDYSHQ